MASDSLQTPAVISCDAEAVLSHYQQLVDKKIEESTRRFSLENPLDQACRYALLNGGKRFRPAVVLMIADALGHGVDVTEAALAIEYFHTASLVVDDLPSMDNDALRRSKPTTHKAYGEAIALLVSYALIAAGYGDIAANAKTICKAQHPFASKSSELGMLALENAAYNTGLMGATGGQFLDICPPDLSLATLREILHKKTVSLFEIAFVFGWLFGGGDPEALNELKVAASHFGMAFQIADDLDDIEQDKKNGRKVNMALVFGVEEATRMLDEEIAGYESALKKLKIDSEELMSLAHWLKAQKPR